MDIGHGIEDSDEDWHGFGDEDACRAAMSIMRQSALWVS